MRRDETRGVSLDRKGDEVVEETWLLRRPRLPRGGGGGGGGDEEEMGIL